MPLPRRDDERPPRRRRIRGLGPAIAVVVVLGLIGTGGWIASQAVYFVGTDSDGFVSVYHGLPYDLPLGIHLYQRDYVSGVPADELTTPRRKRLLDHTLRSHDDARDLVRRLELGQVDSA